jgi:serine/threonine protein kinase
VVTVFVRFKVIVDVATALVYLHTECEERIIHRDVKAANVMLDAKFNARLGDFGLARAYNHSLLTPESTNVAGTFGYLAPELFHTGAPTSVSHLQLESG